jgi:hypothetical protein
LAFGLWSLAFGLWVVLVHAFRKFMDQRPKSKDQRPSPKTNSCMCDAEQQRLLTVNQADLNVLRRCESYHMHQVIADCQLPIADWCWSWNFGLRSLPGKNQSAIGNRQSKMSRRGSLTGKAVVLKTTAIKRLQVQVLSLPPKHCRFPIADCRLEQFRVSSLKSRFPRVGH